MRHRLSARADSDVAHIYDRSIRDFGVRQADRYYDGLMAAVLFVAEHPEAGRKRDLGRTFRFHPYEAHVIIYEVRAEEVLIVRVLHQHQDRARHL